MTLHSHLHLAIQSIHCFTDDGRLDEAEINYLMGLAMADHVIDQDENRVLGSIFRQALGQHCSERTKERILAVMKKHAIQ